MVLASSVSFIELNSRGGGLFTGVVDKVKTLGWLIHAQEEPLMVGSELARRRE